MHMLGRHIAHTGPSAHEPPCGKNCPLELVLFLHALAWWSRSPGSALQPLQGLWDRIHRDIEVAWGRGSSGIWNLPHGPGRNSHGA